MKTLTLFILSSIGLLTTSLVTAGICLGLVAYLFCKWELKKDSKIERSDESFQKVMKKECECKNPCNEHCANSKRYNI